jgi:hypothetical protein
MPDPKKSVPVIVPGNLLCVRSERLCFANQWSEIYLRPLRANLEDRTCSVSPQGENSAPLHPSPGRRLAQGTGKW